jgi:hypothetical protein
MLATREYFRTCTGVLGALDIPYRSHCVDRDTGHGDWYQRSALPVATPVAVIRPLRSVLDSQRLVLRLAP